MKQRDRQSALGLLPRMEARPRKDGLVTYRFHPAEGKPVNLGTDKQAAIRKVLDLNLRAPDQGTVGALWRLYQDDPRYIRLGEKTKVDYGRCWKALCKVFELGVVSQIRPSDINRYLRQERAAAPVRANREMALLSNLMNLAVERGEIDANPCKQVRRNTEESRTRLVEAKELDAFVAWALEQGKSAVVLVSMAQFAALTGNRRAEFLKLHWPQVDEAVIRLTRAKQRKGKERRELVGVSDALKAVLERVKAQEGYNPMGAVFRAPKTGNPYSEAGFKAMWARLMDKALAAGIVAERFTFHDLRAHYTTHFKLKFGQLPELHADPATTAGIYDRSREVRRQSL
jgi:integrase